jgi:hypothetical protein
MGKYRELSHSDIEHLIDDANYLIDEAEALKYVIDSVPFNEAPPEGDSIIDMLRLINFAQKEYYKPVTERVFTENRLIKLNEIVHFKKAYTEQTEEKENDIQKVLNKIIKNRAALINLFYKITVIDWERVLKDYSGEEITLYTFIANMVKEERGVLKKIADLVLLYQNELQSQREINSKMGSRKFSDT